jgi:hypothetical protein
MHGDLLDRYIPVPEEEASPMHTSRLKTGLEPGQLRPRVGPYLGTTLIENVHKFADAAVDEMHDLMKLGV